MKITVRKHMSKCGVFVMEMNESLIYFDDYEVNLLDDSRVVLFRGVNPIAFIPGSYESVAALLNVVKGDKESETFEQ